MTDLLKFKAIRIQWHRALFVSHLLKPSEKVLGSYLVNVRLNWKTGQLNPAVDRIAVDLGVDRRTIQRGVNRLEHLGWFGTDRGAGRGLSSNYYVTDESINIAEEIRSQCNAEKGDTGVALSIVKPWQDRRERVTPLSRKRRQECHLNSIMKNKTKNAAQCDAKPVQQWVRSGRCPITAYVIISETDTERVLEWNTWLATCGWPNLDQLSIRGSGAEKHGYILPRRFVPSSADDLEMVRSYFRWAIDRAKPQEFPLRAQN